MVFNSFDFLGFFLIVFAGVWVLGRITENPLPRNLWLLTLSYYFYGSFRIEFLALLLYVSLVTYLGGLWLDRLRSREKPHRKGVLALIITLSLLPLLYWKYAGFLYGSVTGALGLTPEANPFAGLLLPVGISFFTFQALTYTIDIHRGKIAADRNIIDVFLFVAFFPTLLSGPIERARKLLPQLKNTYRTDFNTLFSGAMLFSWGLFKKMVVADRLAHYVDQIYFDPSAHSGATLCIAAIFYSIQIYCDFSGYSDMAIGVARSIGFSLDKNFDQPYFVTSIREFWKKWHISLTSWFTEYIYIPAGGNRVGKVRWVGNIFLVFLTSALWHGAAWSFLVWGALHALYYLTEHLIHPNKEAVVHSRLRQFGSGILVFALVTLAWIFFRIENIHDAFDIVKRIFTWAGTGVSFGTSSFSFVLTCVALLLFFAGELALRHNALSFEENPKQTLSLPNIWWMATTFLLISLLGVSGNGFVYFQF